MINTMCKTNTKAKTAYKIHSECVDRCLSGLKSLPKPQTYINSKVKVILKASCDLEIATTKEVKKETRIVYHRKSKSYICNS